jgi:hypothetical protein
MKILSSSRLIELITFLLSLIAINVAGKDAVFNIAVNDLKGNGIDQSVADIISDRLRAELVNAGVFRVMERAEMNNIFKEQGFQKSGACDESSCLAQVGQLLGVQRMVAGSIGKVGNFWTISLRMLNVATGEILFTVSEDYEGDIKGVVSTAVTKAAGKLSSGVDIEVKKASMIGKKGDLYIASSQPGASIEIDNTVISGMTPLTIQGFAAGEHRIVVRKGDWYGSQNILLNPDDLLKISVTMEREKGSVKIFSSPIGANVTIDGKKAGETPLKVDSLTVGEHEICLASNDFVGVKQTVKVSVGITQNISVTLNPAAYLTINVSPESAVITINGKTAEKNSENRMTISAGDVAVHVEAVGCNVYDTNLALAKDESKTLTICLQSVFSTLKISSTPSEATVWINNVSVGKTPYVNRLILPGSISLKLEKPTFSSITENQFLVKGQTYEKNYALIHSKAFLDSLASIKRLAYKKRQWVRRTILCVFASGFTGSGYFFNSKADDGLARMGNIQTTYREASTDFATYKTSFDQERKQVNRYEVTRNVMYILGGACALGLGFSIWF